MSLNFLIVLFTSLCVLNFGDASKIVFDASPSEINPFLTRTLTLHCGLNDTIPDSSNNIVGRDVTSTVNNVQHVTQVMVTRGDGTEVASVNSFSPAKSLNSTWQITVTGSVGSTAGERGFIEISFDHPDETAGGTYRCVVDAYTNDGHHIVYTQTLQVTSAASINDLIKHVSLLDAMVYKQEAKNMNQDNIIKTLENQTQQQAALIDRLQKDSYHNVTAIMKSVAKYHHIEMGVIDCGTLGIMIGSSNNISHQFSQSYDQTPDVSLAISQFDIHDDASDDKSVSITLQTVDTNGFTVRCDTDSSYVYSMHVSWISFPN